MISAEHAVPVALIGGPHERGHAQRINGGQAGVVHAITARLIEHAPTLERPEIRIFLSRQWAFATEHCPDQIAEMVGVAEGFGLESRELFAFLHLGVIADLGGGNGTGDGCSVWASGGTDEGPVVGKNRDYLGEHAGLQRVFLHEDPAWPGSRRVLCVGSLGIPGAYSSGMNSDGLSVADTQIATPDHGIGWLRYFLMSRLLERHATVADALEEIGGMQHVGGGSLVLADAEGAVAAVDLGHSQVKISIADSGRVSRTNHYAAQSVASTEDQAPMRASSEGRLTTIDGALADREVALDELRSLMASHDSEEATGLCRHGQDGDSSTLSTALFACQDKVLYFCHGNPCTTDWSRYTFD